MDDESKKSDPDEEENPGSTRISTESEKPIGEEPASEEPASEEPVSEELISGASEEVTPNASEVTKKEDSTLSKYESALENVLESVKAEMSEERQHTADIENEESTAIPQMENEEDSKQSSSTQQEPPPKKEPSPKVTHLKDASQQPSANHMTPFASSRLLQRRSPFVHSPPFPEERRARISQPRTPRDYIINLREDLADFQESHGLPRTRDYSFLSLGLALAQETGRAIYSVFLMIMELFPIIAIVSLILRFALDKVSKLHQTKLHEADVVAASPQPNFVLRSSSGANTSHCTLKGHTPDFKTIGRSCMIEILETEGTIPRAKKAAVFVLQILVIMIPLWILIGTIIIPLFYLILSIVRKLFRLTGRREHQKRRCKLEG